MSRLRLRARWRDRSELHELSGPDVIVGSDPSCDLVLDHRSVSATHARVLLRRGRLIVADLGRASTGVTRGVDRLSAPVTLNPGQEVGIGEIGLSGFVDDRGAPDLSRLEDGPTGPELDSPDPEVRRWLTRSEGKAGELLAISPRLEAGPWLARAGRICALREAELGVRTAFESLSPGVRLDRLLRAVGDGRIALPAEALVVLAVGLLRGVAELHERFGPHGLIDPRRIQLGLDGSVQLVLPGPIDDFRDPRLEPFLAPERRYGLPPTFAADLHGTGVIALGLVDDLALNVPGLLALTAEQPDDRPTDGRELAEALLTAAHRAELDPTAHHLGRVVQVVEPSPEGRFSYSGRRREALPKREPTG